MLASGKTSGDPQVRYLAAVATGEAALAGEKMDTHVVGLGFKSGLAARKAARSASLKTLPGF